MQRRTIVQSKQGEDEKRAQEMDRPELTVSTKHICLKSRLGPSKRKQF